LHKKPEFKVEKIMRTRKGFTLIELLVVIAIIALLLSIVTPALKKAREMGQRVACQNQLRTIGMANVLYANDNNGSYVPIYDSSMPVGHQHWVTNDAFRSYLDMDSFRSEGDGGNYIVPRAFLCPSDRISIDPANVSSQGVMMSYGYNLTDWGWGNFGNYAGHKTGAIKMAAVKLAFSDGIDWWVEWAAADYRIGWDLIGQASIDTYKARNIHGPTIYRHSEGSNIGFYDGHVEYQSKHTVFVAEDRDASPRRPGMWVVNLQLYQKHNR
jgi:prepilin-type N-terminal cleavage/methylation domain-containing protein/prepilin-type processing-associated H-X9-DG protein